MISAYPARSRRPIVPPARASPQGGLEERGEMDHDDPRYMAKHPTMKGRMRSLLAD